MITILIRTTRRSTVDRESWIISTNRLGSPRLNELGSMFCKNAKRTTASAYGQLSSCGPPGSIKKIYDWYGSADQSPTSRACVTTPFRFTAVPWTRAGTQNSGFADSGHVLR